MFTISEKANKNYLAKIVEIKNIRKHSNADKLQIFTIDGNNVITGLDAKDGDIGVYFPLECAISSEFISATNSFREPERNADKTSKGFFEYHGRVRAIKLRGEKSEGYFVPIHSVLDWGTPEGSSFDAPIGTEFDTINGNLLVEKYVPRGSRTPGEPGSKDRKKARETSILIEGQFRFHEDTPQLGKNLHRVNSNDIITVTYKLHGTSFVSSNILCKRKLSWVEKVAKYLGARIEEKEYKNIYSSRKVIKNDRPKKSYNHYYKTDIWGDVNNYLKEYLSEGLTFYGEIVGYTNEGTAIQKGYDYGNPPGHHDTYIYRITYTNPEGEVFEFSWTQVKDYCNKYGLNHVPEMYHGKAKHLFPISEEQHFHENFFEALKQVYLEKDCHLCENKVPAEGVTLRVDSSEWEIFKLKSFRFLEKESKELDSEEVDIETLESVADELG